MLRHPRALLVAVVLALALAAPTLGARFYADDYLFVGRLEGSVPSIVPGPFSLYVFADPARAVNPIRDFVWWSVPDVHVAFLRPLASALFALDHAVFGHWQVGYHLTTLLWFALSVVAAAGVLRRLLPEREAALATILFAISGLHASAAGWPSARHVTIAAVFGFAALSAHLDARRAGRTFAPLALGLAAIGLGASEGTLGALGYVLAHEALGPPGDRRSRLAAVAPYAVLALGYVTLHHALGYGVAGSGEYIDPIREPLAMLVDLPRRVGPLLTAALLSVPSETAILAPSVRLPELAIGALSLGLYLVIVRAAARRVDAATATNLRVLAVGAALSVVPAIGGVLGDRLLSFASLALAAAVAVTLLHGARAARVFVGVVHLGLSPLVFLVFGLSLLRGSRAGDDACVAVALPPGTREIASFGLADPTVGLYWAADRAVRGLPPVDFRLLTISMHEHVLRRRDDHTLDVALVGGNMLEGGFERLVRPPSAPLAAGTVVDRPGWRMLVLEDDHGAPTRFAVTFDRALDDPALALMTWRDGALRLMRPPAPGEELRVAHEPGPSGM